MSIHCRLRDVVVGMCMVLAWNPAAHARSGGAPDSFMTPRVERAIHKGLKWLARNQRRNGSWGQSNMVGTTALALMAFVVNGHLPDRGEYGHKVAKGAKWLLKQADLYTGYIGNSMYEHGFATLVLAELFGEWKEPKLQDVLERAVGLIVKSQNQTGGWRYSPGSTSMDLSVSAAVIQAIRAAREAYMDIPKKTIRRAVRAVKSCASSQGTFGYTPGGGGGSAQRFGLGVASLLSLGAYDDRVIRRAVRHLRRSGGISGIAASPYHAYYATLALYQAGGKAWSRLYPRLQRALLRMQDRKGGFRGGMYSGGRGEVNAAFAIIALSIPKGFIPLFQR